MDPDSDPDPAIFIIDLSKRQQKNDIFYFKKVSLPITF
jgi:hypothetical protein